MSRVVCALGALLLAGCPKNPTAPPTQPGDCKSHADATQTVEVGLGESDFTLAKADGGTFINYGAQGGRHVWAAVRATGFDGTQVNITLTATDPFSGAKLGEGNAFDTPLNAEKGAGAQSCDYYGIPLFLYGRQGLALITANVLDMSGHTATGSVRVWLGDPQLPACIPQDGVMPAIVPAYGMTYGGGYTLIKDGDTISLPSTNPDLQLKPLLQGFADSATTITAELRDPAADPTAAPLSTVTTKPGAGEAGSPDPGPPLRCVSAQRGSLPVSPGMPLLLHLSADDGLGHKAEDTRHVTFVITP
jgi:hypothetical protein